MASTLALSVKGAPVIIYIVSTWSTGRGRLGDGDVLLVDELARKRWRMVISSRRSMRRGSSGRLVDQDRGTQLRQLGILRLEERSAWPSREVLAYPLGGAVMTTLTVTGAPTASVAR